MIEKKKYALKKDLEKVVYSADGIDNKEHILDLLAETELLFNNIQDNVDICINIYKLQKEKNLEEDELDAIQIACENCVELEKSATKIYQEIKEIKESKTVPNEDDIKRLNNQMKSFENKSKKLLEGILC